MERKFFHNIKVLLYLGFISYVNCLHLISSNYNLKPSSYLGADSGLFRVDSGLSSFGSQLYNPLMLGSETDPFMTVQKSFGLLMPPPVMNTEDIRRRPNKAYSCSLLPCFNEDIVDPVCACNFNTGKVVTFRNNCDVKKHNCRFDTIFKVMLNEICPWEFQSRRDNRELEFDYNDPKYYN